MSCVLDGLIVLPYSAVALGQVMLRVRKGLKVSMTVGMISAFFSLGNGQLETGRLIKQVAMLVYQIKVGFAQVIRLERRLVEQAGRGSDCMEKKARCDQLHFAHHDSGKRGRRRKLER